MTTKGLPHRPNAGGRGGIAALNSSRAPYQAGRAREPINRSFGLVRGKFPSAKMGRMIHWESQLERDAVFLFEFSPGVTAYREQPFTTYYALDGKTRRYTPDFELTLSTGELLVIEVKPAAKLEDPDMAKRLARIRDHFASNDRPYRILTDTEIRQSALLENLKIILRHRRAALTLFERRRTVELLPNATTFSFATAARLLGSDGVVWGLICEGLLRCDLTQLVNNGTVLHIAREGASYDQLLF